MTNGPDACLIYSQQPVIRIDLSSDAPAPSMIVSQPFGLRRTAAHRLFMAWLITAAALIAPVCFLPLTTADAATAKEIDTRVDQALKQFYKKIHNGRELISGSPGVLVFPDVFKAGFGVGGEYGEGALRINGRTAGYYNTVGLSAGLQLGAQSRSEVIIFRDRKALEKFRRSKGWKVGVDGSVALAKLGAGGTVDSDTLQEPIVAFIFDNQGLMYNLTLEGSKISKMKMR